jgi:hypothetical protein
MSTTVEDTPAVQAAAQALEACVAGLALTHPRMLAFTDQVDWTALLARTPLGESCALAALGETMRTRINTVPGYLAAQTVVIPLLDAYLAAVQEHLATGPDRQWPVEDLDRACTQSLSWLKRTLVLRASA